MRRLLFGIALMLAAAAPAASHAPFSPVADRPDHVVTMVEHSAHRKEDLTRTVLHRGDWTRVDTRSVGHVSTEYYHRSCKPFPRHGRDLKNNYLTVAVSRGCHRTPGWNYEPVRTDERQTFLGESCTVWTAWRSDRFAGSELVATSCVTDDGIELWYKITSRYGFITAAEATRVERRAVARAEAEPRADMLSLDGWFKADTGAAAFPEYETVMARDGKPEVTRTLRRHGGWTYDEVTLNGARHEISVANPSRRLAIGFYNLETPDALLAWSQPSQAAPESPNPMQPKMLERRETLLGETCSYFDMMPDVAQVSFLACKTNDGVTLIEEHRGHGHHQIDRAVSFRRGPFTLHDVMPPPDLLARKAWGLPE
jgi:hypothetical protein